MAVIEAIHSDVRTLRLDVDDRPALLTALREAAGGDGVGSFLFESDLDGRRVAILCGAPLYVASIYRDRSRLEGPRGHGPATSGVTLLRRLLDAYRSPLSGLAGIAQSVFTIVAYDAARQFEAKLGQAVRTRLPDIWAMVPRIALAIDLEAGEAVLIRNRSGAPTRASELDEIERALRRVEPQIHDEPANGATLRARAQTSREQYCAAVARARE
jgi:hypothetical protein